MAVNNNNPIVDKGDDKLVFSGIKNENLICHDCKLRYEDSVLPCNTSKCEIYQVKPDEVLSGGECDEYLRE